MLYLLAVLLTLLGGSAGADPLRVFVSVLPQKTFVERVGGPGVEVQVMVQPGASPHTYDPTPRQVAALARADLYVAVGVSFEDAWMGRIRAANPRMQVLDSSQGIDLRAMEAPDHDAEPGHGHADEGQPAVARGLGGQGTGPAEAGEGVGHDHQVRDPHLWTSPPLVKQMAAGIRDALTQLDPGNGPTYAANYAAFAAELDSLDREIRARLAGVANRRFMVFHPAWGYFADTYGLTQVPIERGGKEPGPRALAALIDQARREQVRVIFVQPQFSRKAAAQVASAIGGRVEVMDPLAPDYLGNLRRVASVLVEAGTPRPSVESRR
jgi:zinc transport system substrate-binding protein